MSVVPELLARHRERLSGFPAPLQQQFEAGLRALAPRLTPTQLEMWSQSGIELTSLSLRSWEAAVEYFRAGAELPPTVDWESLETLGRESVSMAAESAPLAMSFLRAAPAAARELGPSHLRQWADLGRRLYKGNWKSSSLAAQFYDLAGPLFEVVRLNQAARLVVFIDELSRHSYELASACLTTAPNVLSGLDEDDRVPFVHFATELAQSSWADSRLYFERGVHLLQKVHGPARERYLTLAAQVARGHNRSAFQYFEDTANAIGELEPDDHFRIIELAEQLAPHSAYAAMDFLVSVPTVLSRIRMDELDAWQDSGLRILQMSHDGGEAYFRLQSTRGEDVLDTLSARVELGKVGEVMRLYCKALTGRNLSLQSSSTLAEKGIGWVDQDRASTEGTTIFLPDSMERYHDKADNFAAMKVFATHQAGRIEFGSFEFSTELEPANLQSRLAAALSPASRQLSRHIEAFFDLFPDRKMASRPLHPGRRRPGRRGNPPRVRRHPRSPSSECSRNALAVRSDVRKLPLRQAFVENLVRASLDGDDAVLFPKTHREEWCQGLGLLGAAFREGSNVDDSAEATFALYRIASMIPNTIESDEDEGDWEEVEANDTGEKMSVDVGELGGEGAETTDR